MHAKDVCPTKYDDNSTRSYVILLHATCLTYCMKEMKCHLCLYISNSTTLKLLIVNYLQNKTRKLENFTGVYADMEFEEGDLVLKDQMLVGVQHSSNKVPTNFFLRF